MFPLKIQKIAKGHLVINSVRVCGASAETCHGARGGMKTFPNGKFPTIFQVQFCVYDIRQYQVLLLFRFLFLIFVVFLEIQRVIPGFVV